MSLKVRHQFYLHQQGLGQAPSLCAQPSASPSQEQNSSPWVCPWSVPELLFRVKVGPAAQVKQKAAKSSLL